MYQSYINCQLSEFNGGLRNAVGELRVTFLIWIKGDKNHKISGTRIKRAPFLIGMIVTRRISDKEAANTMSGYRLAEGYGGIGLGMSQAKCGRDPYTRCIDTK